MEEKYKNSHAYVTDFNPRKYMEEFYSSLKGSEEGDMLEDLFQANIELSNMLPTEGLGKALDFGCGPVVLGVMPVADKVDSILFADYVPANLKVFFTFTMIVKIKEKDKVPGSVC